VPAVNWTLLFLVVLLVLGFKQSTSLASAYGIAVTGTMFITTLHARRSPVQVWALESDRGGHLDRPVPGRRRRLLRLQPHQDSRRRLVPAVGRGDRLHRAHHLGDRPPPASRRLEEGTIPLPVFIKSAAGSLHRVSGTSVFMSATADAIPSALLHNIKHNQVLHERVIILTVQVEEIPHVDAAGRVTTEDFGEGFYRIVMRYGFMEEPDVPRDLARLDRCGPRFDLMRTSFSSAAEADRLEAPRHGAVARASVRLDDEELGIRDGILQAPDQSRHRARQPVEL